MSLSRTSINRRTFLTGSAVLIGAPAVITASKTDSEVVLGEGDHRFAVQHHWPQLPAEFRWQISHGVAIDKEGLVYLIHMGSEDLKDHPTIFVFTPEGKYVRSFGKEFHGGGHGIEIREEAGEEFLYVAVYQHLKTIAKLTLKGETVWKRMAPMESKVFAEGEDTRPTKVRGRDRFLPTNFAFLDDGGFLLADGYGSFYIHRYDRDGQWKGMFGGPGDGQGKFDTPHGLCVDRRPGREPSLMVCDRAHHTLQVLSLDGQYRETITGFGLPANVDTWKDLMVVPELHARVSILDGQNRVVARLGDDVQRITADAKFTIRTQPDQWQPGKFVHPHDACFDRDGNIYVVEWMASGRISKLTRV